MREGMILHEPGAQTRGPLCFSGVATSVRTLDKVEHEVGQNHHPFGRLYQAATHLSSGRIGNVFMLGDQRNLLIGQVTVV